MLGYTNKSLYNYNTKSDNFVNKCIASKVLSEMPTLEESCTALRQCFDDLYDEYENCYITCAVFGS